MTEQNNAYEGMFLFPQAQAGSLQAAVDHINEILAKAEVEVISFSKWDERRLAYEIKGNKRGVYFLVYFRAAAGAMTAIERACNLSELILRSMITRADRMTQEQMEATDGMAQLTDEIKLRDQQEAEAAAPPPAPAPQADDKSEPAIEAKEASPDASVTVETETAAKDAATTLET